MVINRLMLVFFCALIAYSVNAQKKFSITPKIGQYTHSTLIVGINVDDLNVGVEQARSELQWTFGVALNYRVSERITLSLNFDNSDQLSQGLRVRDDQDITQFGVLTYPRILGFKNGFYSLYASLPIFRLNNLNFSFNVGPEALFQKMNSGPWGNVGSQRLQEFVALVDNSYKPVIWHLRLGFTLNWKRAQFSVAWKEDFENSASDGINYSGQHYDFIHDRKLLFFNLGYTVFKF